MGEDKPQEGVVIRPIIELHMSNGERVMAKHKREEFSERGRPTVDLDPSKREMLANADGIALEWVTPMRLEHVLQRIPADDMSAAPKVIAAMVEDIYREGKGEIVESREATAAM